MRTGVLVGNDAKETKIQNVKQIVISKSGTIVPERQVLYVISVESLRTFTTQQANGGVL